MCEEDVRRLQGEIQEVLAANFTPCRSILLGRGSDVTDLTSNVDVDVELRDGSPELSVVVVTAAWMTELLTSKAKDACEFSAPYHGPHFCIQAPLCIVHEITGGTVVSAVLRALFVRGRI